MKKAIMEFLGTFFFVLAIALNTSPFAIACMLMAWIYIAAHISGSHFNPMVSLAVYLCNKLSQQDLVRYIVAQVLGGAAAYALAWFLHGSIAIPHPGANTSLLQAFIVEILFSFILASIVLYITSEKYKGNQIFGFAISFTVPALVLAGGPISGGVFNPAVALGSHIFGILKNMPIAWEHLAMYVVGALLGGCLAAYLFKFFNEKTSY